MNSSNPPRAQRPALSCVIPAYNEADSLPLFLPQLWEALRHLTDRFEISPTAHREAETAKAHRG